MFRLYFKSRLENASSHYVEIFLRKLLSIIHLSERQVFYDNRILVLLPAHNDHV